MSAFVYALVDGERVRYVGFSAALEQRRETHRHAHPDWSFLALGAYPTREEGLEAERWWIRRLHERGEPLINVSEGGDYCPTGRVFSPLTRSKMSSAQKGRHLGNHNARGHSVEPEARARMAHWKGKRPSAETRARLSAALKGKNVGRRHSAETRAKNSAAKKGKPWSPSRRAAYERGVKVVGNPKNKGRPVSAEVRARLAAAARKQWASPGFRERFKTTRAKSWSPARRVAYERRKAEAETP